MGAGVSLALPWLETLTGTSQAGAQAVKAAGASGLAVTTQTKAASSPRLVCVGNPYGMIPENFFPEQNGLKYKAPVLLEPMEAHRGSYTVWSNLDHGYSGGHRVADTFLTGVKTVDAAAMPEGNISIDQKAGEFVGADTRFSVLNLGVSGGCEMSWTRTGVNVPVVSRSRDVFSSLFVQDSKTAIKAMGERNKLHGSILDLVQENAKSLNKRLSRRDQEKFEEYLTSVEGVERQLEMNEHWRKEPKPIVNMKAPDTRGYAESLPVFYDLMVLALQTDSTRVITLETPETMSTSDLNLSNGYHGYSHHGKNPQKMRGLTVIENYQMQNLADFLGKLKTIETTGGGSLFDETMTLFGSGMGNGSSHSNKNLPIMLAGGGFNHKGHVKLPEQDGKRVPLCNLYVTMLQRFGLELDSFNTSNGVLEV